MRAHTESRRTRYISAATDHRLFDKYRGLCSNCGTGRAIERDHIVSFAMGGSNDFENLQLLCRNCNQRKAIETYGVDVMRSFLREPDQSYSSRNLRLSANPLNSFGRSRIRRRRWCPASAPTRFGP
ncbi:MAG: HNH endonuclease signature motif containing protein [Bdellovibrionota bacterium]